LSLLEQTQYIHKHSSFYSFQLWRFNQYILSKRQQICPYLHCVRTPRTDSPWKPRSNECFYCRVWGSHSGGYVEFYLLGYNTM
jgi:hypothetical protein